MYTYINTIYKDKGNFMKLRFKIKRMLAILLSTAAALSIAALCACGNGGNSNNGGGNGGNEHTCEYDKGVVEKEASCTEDGIKRITCKICGKTIKITVDGGHKYGDWVIVTPADCANEGQESKTCKSCGGTVTRVIERTQHSFDENVPTDEEYHRAGCNDCGEGQYGEHDMKNGRCTECGYETGDTLGLEFESWIEEGYMLTGIGYNAGAKQIKIPATYKGLPVIAINDNAFDESQLLKSIIIPAGVRFVYNSIGEYPNPFAVCSYLEEIIVDEDNQTFSSDNGVLFSKDKKILYRIPMAVEEFTVPEGVTEIADGAFYGCGALKKISLPQTLVKIGKKAFENCRELVEITIPQSVELIDEYAFNNTSLLNATFEYIYYDAKGFNKYAMLGSLLKSSSTAASYLKNKYASYSFIKVDPPSVN